ncbi:hypothetical protein G6M50_06275 [Agrobacterium rhizogenes]|nr:hypothetical protein [Rhizobium rhizogenes]NTJ77409.1 hypothetical protein [Rhizobium rhizogenes]
MASSDSFVIWILKSILTDGSEAFAVELNGESYDCITEKDAEDFAESLQELFEKHTNVEVGISRGND